MKRTMLMAAALFVSAFAVANAAPQEPVSSEDNQKSLTMAGRLTSSDNKFFLEDQATSKTVEVRGKGLKKYSGKKVKVTGVLVSGAAGSAPVLAASSVSVMAISGAAVATGAAAAGVKAGLSTAAVVGIAGGATAATVGTLAATDVIGGEEEPVSRQ